MEPSARTSILEYTDNLNRTPLILAVQKKHLSVARTLVQLGANVNQMSMEERGGSALHEAVLHNLVEMVNFLVDNEANPFVSNCKDRTAYDLALNSERTIMIRKMETRALYAGWLAGQSPRMFTGHKWLYRWVIVLHRYPYPHQPANQHIIRACMVVFEGNMSYKSSLLVWLDGATVRAPPDFGRGGESIVITLHTSHNKPQGGLVIHSNPSRGGYQIHFRCCTSSDESVNYARGFVAAINDRQPFHHQRPQQAPVAVVNHPTAAAAAAASPYWNQSLQSSAPPFEPSATASRQLPQAQASPQPSGNVSDEDYARMVAEQDGSLSVQDSLWQESSTKRGLTDSQLGLDRVESPAMSSAPPVDYPQIDSPTKGLAVGTVGPYGQAAGPSEGGISAGECVLCQDAPCKFGFMHAESIHMGLCEDCVDTYRTGQYECPLCRQKIEKVVRVYT